MAAPFPSPTKKWHTTAYDSISPTRPELSAKGKSILITGGGTGIGARTALYFAQAGASRIALLGRREQPLLDTKASILKEYPNVDIFTSPTDVTNQDQVNSAFSKFAGPGKIDIVISGSGTVGPQIHVNDVPSTGFFKALNSNLSMAFNVAQAFARHASIGAVVVNISSSAAHVNFGANFSCYNTSKWAAVKWWDTWAFGNKERGVRVFHLQPGVVDTDMNKEAGGVKAVGFEDDASFMVWLASPEAKFLDGKFLWANWDVDELKARAEELEKGPLLSLGLVGWPFDGAVVPKWGGETVDH